MTNSKINTTKDQNINKNSDFSYYTLGEIFMKNVLLVFGGMSYEHDISVVTASQIYSKTKLLDTKLILFYVSRDNRFFIYLQDKFTLSDFKIENFNARNKKFKEVVFVSNEKGIVFAKTKFGLKEYIKTDIAIFAMHGGAGENGKFQAIFEDVGIYSSCGNFDSLAICMNKYLFKQVMLGIKVPTVSGFKLTLNDIKTNKKEMEKKLDNFGFPLVIKSNNGGSSIGLFVAENKQDFFEKLEDSFEFDNEILIEKFIDGCREFNVAVIGDNENFEISEIDEPLKEHEILSFTDKYCSDAGGKSVKIDMSLKNSMASSLRKFPADIPLRLQNRIKKFAYKIFKQLGLRGVVRIDFLYNEKDNKIYVCEVNAIPGSLSFYFFNQNKLIINDFVNKLINIAEKYKEDHFLINKEYITDVLK